MIGKQKILKPMCLHGKTHNLAIALANPFASVSCNRVKLDPSHRVAVGFAFEL